MPPLNPSVPRQNTNKKESLIPELISQKALFAALALKVTDGTPESVRSSIIKYVGILDTGGRPSSYDAPVGFTSVDFDELDQDSSEEDAVASDHKQRAMMPSDEVLQQIVDAFPGGSLAELEHFLDRKFGSGALQGI